MTPDERRIYAQTMFEQHPELFPEERRGAILQGRVELGMTPFEAKLAGGAFAFKVVADQSKWPPHADPYKVMWAQSMLADNSEIWMTFNNTVQFDTAVDCPFRVHFSQGHASSIDKLDN